MRLGVLGAEDHGQEIGERVVAGVRVEARIHRVRHAGEEQRVAVRRGALHLLRGDVAARAGLVLDHHRLAERLGELRLHQARDQVGGAARRKADHDVHRLLRAASPAPAPGARTRSATGMQVSWQLLLARRCYHPMHPALNILFASENRRFGRLAAAAAAGAAEGSFHSRRRRKHRRRAGRDAARRHFPGAQAPEAGAVAVDGRRAPARRPGVPEGRAARAAGRSRHGRGHVRNRARARARLASPSLLLPRAAGRAALEPAQAVPRLRPHHRPARPGRARQRRRAQAGRARLQRRRLEPPAEEARRRRPASPSSTRCSRGATWWCACCRSPRRRGAS